MMLSAIIRVLGLALAISQISCEVSYDGYAVLRCWPQNTKQLKYLEELRFEGDGLSFWNEPSGLNQSVDIMVAPGSQDSFSGKLREWTIPSVKIIENVDEAVNKSKSEPGMSRLQSSNVTEYAAREQDFYRNYQSYDMIEARLNQLSRHPLVQLESIGKTTENRVMHLVKISTDPSADKPVIFIDGLHHAREWISGATAMYIIDSLLLNHARNKKKVGSKVPGRYPTTKLQGRPRWNLLDQYDVWVVPVVNPDGYEYTRLKDRLWRKTRSTTRAGSCVGVDLNRNYPFHWNEAGTSLNCNHETYAGPRASSEVEVQNMISAISAGRDRIAMYISLHAYGQVILSPYGYARRYPENYEEMKRVAEVGIRTIASIRNTPFRFGTAAILLYPAAGGADDFAYGVLGVPYSYTIELPDKGYHGFLLPPREIRPVGRETFAGISAMAQALPLSRS